MGNAAPRIAYFVSSHGFGHATRACAVMAAVAELAPAAHFEIYTQVPAWLFADSLAAPFTLHPLLTDIGVAQADALREDLPLTAARLDAFLPFDPALVARLAAELGQGGCTAVVCDIAPLGLAVARAAGLPSVLVENFTWDWIYAGYTDEEPRLKPHLAYLRDAFALADYRLQTEPAHPAPGAHLLAAPVSRRPRLGRAETRRRLGLPPAAPAVLVTTGGLPAACDFWDRLAEGAGGAGYFIAPAADPGSAWAWRGRLARLPMRSEFFHLDLLEACDAVVGKIGYSTLAETYRAGVPLGYVPRPRFRETAVLVDFARARMAGFEITEAAFRQGDWLARLPALLAMPRRPRPAEDGAQQVAEFICRRVNGRPA